MYYLLIYETVANYVEKRAPYRTEHLELAQEARNSGALVLAGALSDPADGAVLVFKGSGPEVAEDFARNDPFVINGLITKWTVRAWAVVIGNDT
jgi:uncharacterized protein YciI